MSGDEKPGEAPRSEGAKRKTGKRVPTPRFPRVSIRLDVIAPGDFIKYRLPFACEDCTHFGREAGACTLGYLSTPHRKAEQLRSYLLRGKMALCRFLEID